MPLTATPLLDLYESQARAAAQAAEAWRAAPAGESPTARDLDDVIAALADAPQRVEAMYHAAWGRATEGPVRGCVPMGEAVFRIWDAHLALLRAVRAAADPLAAEVRRLSDLDAAIGRLERHRAQAYDGWPWFRPEDVVEAEAQIARGEYVTNEDLLREVQDRLARNHAG